MPCKRRLNVVKSDTEEEEDDPEIVETAAPPRARRRLRRAGSPQDAEGLIDLSGSPVKPEGTSGGAAAHGVAAVSTDATQPGFTECTPQRRAPLCTLPVVKPGAIDAPRQRRSSRRQLGVYSSKQAGARDAALARLCRLRSGGGHANSAGVATQLAVHVWGCSVQRTVPRFLLPVPPLPAQGTAKGAALTTALQRTRSKARPPAMEMIVMVAAAAAAGAAAAAATARRRGGRACGMVPTAAGRARDRRKGTMTRWLTSWLRMTARRWPCCECSSSGRGLGAAEAASRGDASAS